MMSKLLLTTVLPVRRCCTILWLLVVHCKISCNNAFCNGKMACHPNKFSTWNPSRRLNDPIHFLGSLGSKIFLNKKDHDPMQEKDKSWNLIDNVDEYPLLLGDLGAIFIACQLQGLSDVLITPDFWNQGGFFQPIVYSTDTGGSFATLSTLVQRDCIASLCWIGSSIKNGGYQSCHGDDGTVTELWKSTLVIFVDACSLRIVGSLFMASYFHTQVNQVELLRGGWFILLIIGTFRWLYQEWTKQ